VTSQAAEYDSGAKSFHWVTAALLATQFTIGWIMPGLGHVTVPEGLISLHFSLGIVILAVAAARLMWRLAFGVPAPEANLPSWQNRAAHGLHRAIYVLLFALLFSGWAYASSHGLAVTLFGLATMPAIFADGSAIGQAFGELHSPLAWVLVSALGLHIAAALAHSLIWRDGVMSRMLPRLR
jgi:cytochrome b561